MKYYKSDILFNIGILFRVLFYLGFAYLSWIWFARAYMSGGIFKLFLAIAGWPLAFFYPLYAWIRGSAFPIMLWVFFLSWLCYFLSVRLGLPPED